MLCGREPNHRLATKQVASFFIFASPIFINNCFTNDSGIPAQTASRFTRLLLDRGILRTIKDASGRRPALYAFEPLLKLVRV